jgi:hypothetical protein
MTDIERVGDVPASNSVLLPAFRSSHCERPRRVRKSDGTLMWIRCGAKNPAFCKSCARIASFDQKRLIGSGCNVSTLDGITHEMLAPFRFFFVTLTAPSFGAIHRDGAEQGTPVSPRKYRFREQVEWNQGSSQLFHATTAALDSRLPDAEWSFVREWQRRGSIHFHGIVRVPRWIDESVVFGELLRLRTVKSGTFKWGAQIDVKAIQEESSGNTVRYMSKVVGYTSKRQGDTDRTMLPIAMQAFYRRLDWHAARLTCNRQGCATNADCRGRMHESFGYAGYMRTQSKRWSMIGLTRSVLDGQRKTFAAQAEKDQHQTALEFVAQLARQDHGEFFTAHDGATPDAAVTMIRERLKL